MGYRVNERSLGFLCLFLDLLIWPMVVFASLLFFCFSLSPSGPRCITLLYRVRSDGLFFFPLSPTLSLDLLQHSTQLHFNLRTHCHYPPHRALYLYIAPTTS